ncbi:MAG: hypothetical protein UV54_C0038G0010 [Candidatus Beckwithbacteria bacterium GW2011_GWA2_43_10]|uniref:Integrase catalytic domain-containing protein n=1 Tax=Candidatus Beckwithbacteria bacterium GW2011_GWA2_43_10 TaxID=1618369 RepID=A0A0G1EXB0_9BACT|nr:MAG: hypothetical protein UV54_C0038G0010 [Candidatus Beckwithbacteria bacterium GW2011_GWA2_43_10]
MLNMSQRQAVTKELKLIYQKAGKKEKGKIIDQLAELTGYHRHYAAFKLNRPWVKRKRRRLPVSFRPRVYDHEVFESLRRVWVIYDGICSKRLIPTLPEAVRKLEECGELTLSPEVKTKLLAISPATMDRMLKPIRQTFKLKGISTTKPGTLLKSQVPIRTFSDWDDKQPGFMEIDLVAHCGDSARDMFIYSLNLTDVSTGWTDPVAVMGRAEIRVFGGLKTVEERLPFSVLGLDSDNDSAFINGELIRYCESKHITFTRCRPYRKNDQAYVEQKNYSVVRRVIGYARFDTDEQLNLINQIYSCLRLYINFCLPVMKLIRKERLGSKVRKHYDEAKTPYRRLLESKIITSSQKGNLNRQYAKLNPAELRRNLNYLLKKLHQTLINERKKNP